VTSYTELLRENQLSDVDCSGDNKIWKIVTPRLLYKNGENRNAYAKTKGLKKYS